MQSAIPFDKREEWMARVSISSSIYCKFMYMRYDIHEYIYK